jgi:hypothetical protein
MYADNALAFTPAAIRNEAKVWRQSCSPTGARPVSCQRLRAGFASASAENFPPR